MERGFYTGKVRERDKEGRRKKPTTERREQMGGNERKTQRKR